VLRNEHFVDRFELLTILTSSIQIKNLMDQHTYNNWVKIKETFEQSGNTDNMFYKRAVVIVKTKRDPLAKFLGDEK
jgi:hypothetical protein